MISLLIILVLPLALLLSLFIFPGPPLLRYLLRLWGSSLRRQSQARRSQLLARTHAAEEELARDKQTQQSRAQEDGWETVESHAARSARNGAAAETEWEGVVGFFHPFCNAGGGGERVLWAAIRATQHRWPKAVCVVYTGDQDVDKGEILQLVESLGSVYLAYEAFSLLVPDVFVDTMGYAFSLAFSKLLFPDVPTGAYVHYPTISTDMLGSLESGGQGVNAGSGKGLKGFVKREYWLFFARCYGWAGGNIDVVMTNSSWTQQHILDLWSRKRTHKSKSYPVTVVFPPVAVEELEREIEISPASEKKRERALLYIAQFRPEKNHALILRAFAEYLSTAGEKASKATKLVLIGSVRHSGDATRVYDLRLLARELKIEGSIEFITNASWPLVLDWLRRSWVGVNGMWNEHFGIGVVEYQAAGLISVVHNSGGPKQDIVVDFKGKSTGFHATTATEYAEAFGKALSLPADETLSMRRRARASAERFTEEAFEESWIAQMEHLMGVLAPSNSSGKKDD
ncbi:MAG: asparagine-linked glycosylation protein [Trizodia sp. TS-e1964]|nr:MAG: asparagine-linked glycosylation protein [Trizodia sp. TS-e1964]